MKKESAPLPPWEDHRVQIVYELLCSKDIVPPPEEHWEGYLARHIVAALFPEVKPLFSLCKCGSGMPAMNCDCMPVEE